MAKMPKQKPGKSKQNYSTPDIFIEAVKAKLGITHFSIDLAADASNAKTDRWLGLGGIAEDALASHVQWNELIEFGKWAWLNPPFSKIEPWVAKAYATVNPGPEGFNDSKIAMLVPAAVGSNWWRDYVHKRALVYFLNGRLAFIPDQPKALYPKDCALVCYGWGLEGYRIWSWNKKTSAK